MVGVLGDQSMGDQPLGRQAAAVSRAGAGACTTPSWQLRQAYFVRRVTTTWYCAGIMSTRCERSSPMISTLPPQQGQVVSSARSRSPSGNLSKSGEELSVTMMIIKSIVMFANSKRRALLRCT